MVCSCLQAVVRGTRLPLPLSQPVALTPLRTHPTTPVFPCPPPPLPTSPSACAVFTYPAFFHVVWELPDNASYRVCSYDRAVVRGNETAGVGLGFWVTATKEPKYFACGIFGHCEFFDQKVREGG